MQILTSFLSPTRSPRNSPAPPHTYCHHAAKKKAGVSLSSSTSLQQHINQLVDLCWAHCLQTHSIIPLKKKRKINQQIIKINKERMSGNRMGVWIRVVRTYLHKLARVAMMWLNSIGLSCSTACKSATTIPPAINASLTSGG